MGNQASIAYIARTYIPSDKAHAVQIMNMCSAFAANNVAVKLYHLANTEVNVFEYYGIKRPFSLYTFSTPVKNFSKSIEFYRKVSADVRRNFRPGIIFSRDVYDLLFLSGTDKSLVLEAHVPPASKSSMLLHRLLFRKKNFKRLVVISDNLRNEFERLFKDSLKGKIVVAHDGANIAEHTAGNEAVGWQGRDGVAQIGYIGSLYKGKGVELILDLAPKLPEFDFHVVGGKPADIEKCKSKYDGSNISYHGYVPHGNLDPLYEKFDIVLAPYSEGVVGSSGKFDLTNWMSPLKIFEYMAASKAIVCSDLPVLREVLENMQTALLVRPGDLQAWQNSLKLLGSDEGLRKRLGEQARKVFTENYTWEKRAEHILEGLV